MVRQTKLLFIGLLATFGFFTIRVYAQTETQCFRYDSEDLCGPVPMACGSQACVPVVTEWMDDPSDPNNKEIPKIIEWSCTKRGRFNLANDREGNTCKLIWSTDPQGYRSINAIETVGASSNELCWRTRNCLATCVQMQTSIQISKRWKSTGSTTNAGTIEVHQHNCMEGVEEWEEPENRPPGYSVEEKYMSWFDCVEEIVCANVEP